MTINTTENAESGSKPKLNKESLVDPEPKDPHRDGKHNQTNEHGAATPSLDHHHNETRYYAPPHQRQRWGDTQVAPHTNWGDLFFDVFYVAAAYNIGNLLKEMPSPRGLLYAAGVFFPIMNLWSFKVYYDSRFYYLNDYYHRVYEVFLLCVLATVVLHIRPVSVLSYPSKYPDMFIFCLSTNVGYLFAMGRLLEVVFCFHFMKKQTGLHPEAASSCLRDVLGHVVAFGCVVSATVYSGIQYFSNTDLLDASKLSESYGNDTTNSTDTYNATASINDSPLRSVAESNSTSAPSLYAYSDEPDTIPVWLLLGGTFSSCAWFFLLKIYFSIYTEDHKRTTVPLNIAFIIRRYGEWVLLMLGESVLSLLIVDVVESGDYYKTFVSGLVSIILLQYLHYQSQPTDPNEHAMRRSFGSGFVFYWLTQVYSLSLIVFGSCYKMILYEFVYKDSMNYSSSGKNRRSLIQLVFNKRRWLAESAGSFVSQLDPEDRQQREAYFFSGSLALIFFCLDVLSLAHRGISAQWKLCECADTRIKRIVGWTLVACRVALLAITASMGQFVSDPEAVATAGVFIILSQLSVRYIGVYIFHTQKDAEDKALERVIQYNTARIHDRPQNLHHGSRNSQIGR